MYRVPLLEKEQETTAQQKKMLKFDFTQGDFVTADGKVMVLEDEAALTAWIDKCLRTAANEFLVYMQDRKSYGVDRFNLADRSNPPAFLYAEIEREVTDALLNNPCIFSVADFAFKRSFRALEVSFKVQSVYGTKEVSTAWE